MTRDSAGNTRRTSPVLPLSRPAMTTTLSPFLIFSFGMLRSTRRSQHLRCERHNFHETAGSQFAGHRTKDAGPDRLPLIGNQHCGVTVEPDRAAVSAAYFLCGAYNDRAVHVTLLDPAAWYRLLDRDDDHIADGSGLALRAAQHLDALHSTGAGIVGDVQICL